MITALVVSLLAVAAFGLGLWKSGIVSVARSSVSTALSGVSAMTDSALDDDAKEAAVRKAAFALLGAALSLAIRFAVVLLVTAIPIFLADTLGLTSVDAVMSLMLRWDYILVVSGLAIVLAQVLRRRAKRAASAAAQRDTATGSVNNYSDVDRFLHGIAFSGPTIQKRVSRIEDWVMGRPDVAPEPPIFVTSLARGGTTALLNGLTQIPGIATHTYRDMPFLTAPILWDRLAGGSKRSVTRRDRAHGDGLTIDLDSPEAFEEAIWKMHWPEKYGPDGITLWTATDRDQQADSFLSDHMAKIIRARFGQSPKPPVRYCSKNNANIGRLAYLPEAFPGCEIVVPLRQPTRHAASLHRQHLNFLTLQGEDDFVRKYMSDIGHFEFGHIYTPLGFPEFDVSQYDPQTPNHWLAYWISAFRAVEERAASDQRLILVTQDSLREDPQGTMTKLADRLGLPLSDETFETTFRSTPDVGDDDPFCPDLVKAAQDIYEKLRLRAL